MGVVKANAYGHGAVRIAETLREEGVHNFAVATVPEAIQLREAGIDDTILVLAAPLPAYLPAYIEHDLEVTVPSKAIAEAVTSVARTRGPLRVHLKVDTGMGRLGCTPEEAPTLISMLERAPGVTLSGLWTHFATEDGPDADTQQKRFGAMLAALGGPPAPVHVKSSGVLLAKNAYSLDDSFVRMGLALYGLIDPTRFPAAVGLRPLLTFMSRVTQVKTVPPSTAISYGGTWRATEYTRIATVGAGYGDGYPRVLSNRAVAGLGGRRCPVVGVVCMDMTMIDAGPPDGPAVSPGDPVVLFGEGGPSAIESAQWAGTITYELCCRIAPRVPRIYRNV